MTINNTDDNWSQIRETVLIINVAVARIQHAMIEGDDSFTSLSQSFVETMNSTEAITHAIKELEESQAKIEIDKNCRDVSQRVESTIVAFQFYDKLSQRMALVSQALHSLTEVLKDESKTHSKEEWQNLQNTIRSKYTLDTDQDLFDAVLNGVPIDEALKVAVKKTSENDIEFF